MDIRTKEAIRYLGYGQNEVDKRTMHLIWECFEELKEIAKPKSVYRVMKLSILDNKRLAIGKLEIQSKSLYKNLQGCSEVIILATTLGANVDRQIHRYELLDMAKAVVLQACAAACLEEYCDEIQEDLATKLAESEAYLRPRFSPGYGDFSITYQKDVLEMLDAPKCIGLTMTDGCMLTPTKSVTAVIGISDTKEPCHRKGCEECGKLDCVYRRS